VICRAGLSLRLESVLPGLKESGLLGSIPVLVETAVMSGLSSIVFGIPLTWGLTIGFGVATISPGVCVPLILRILDSGQTRVGAILVPGLALDVLIGTVGFGVALAGCFGHGGHGDESWVWRGMEEVGYGIGIGCWIGGLGVALSRESFFKAHVGSIMFCTSTVAMIWCKTSGFIGAATCSAFITWAILGNFWSSELIEKSNEQ
jgi:solute carrier family 9B (sodium/hydrogen exchanger), member 1/2